MKSQKNGILYAVLNLLYAFYSLIKILLKNFKLSNIFKFSNFLKLFVIYCSGVIWVIVITFNFSDNFFKKLLFGALSDQRFSLYSVDNRIGEKVLYDRIIKVAKDKSMDYSGACFSESLSHFSITKHFYYVAASLINYIFKPDFNLSVTHHVNTIPYGYNITYLNMPSTSLYDYSGRFKDQWSHLSKYQAYADLYTFVHGKNPILDQAIVGHKLKNKVIIPVYLAQYYVDYLEPTIEKAIITGSLWGCGRDSQRIVNALKKLAEDDLIEGYGLKKSLGFLGGKYHGQFEKFGTPIDIMLSLQNFYGITLIIHNLEHRLEGIPTSRISEAVASGSLMITDEHPFVRKYFGDNALYFNALGNDMEIYTQIKDHIIWAQNNKNKVIEKTKNAHNIFKEHLTIEKQFEYLTQEVKKIKK